MARQEKPHRYTLTITDRTDAAVYFLLTADSRITTGGITHVPPGVFDDLASRLDAAVVEKDGTLSRQGWARDVVEETKKNPAPCPRFNPGDRVRVIGDPIRIGTVISYVYNRKPPYEVRWDLPEGVKAKHWKYRTRISASALEAVDQDVEAVKHALNATRPVPRIRWHVNRGSITDKVRWYAVLADFGPSPRNPQGFSFWRYEIVRDIQTPRKWTLWVRDCQGDLKFHDDYRKLGDAKRAAERLEAAFPVKAEAGGAR